MPTGGTLMKITRRFTTADASPYDLIEFRRATSEIKNPDGSIVFRLDGFMVPAQWSQVAADILAQKYFRKAGVARRLKKGGGKPRSRPGLGAQCPTRRHWPSCPRRSATAVRATRGRCSTASPARGPTGASRVATSPPKRMRARSTTRCATCSPCRWRRRTARSGSTPACIGHTASMARARDISTSTSKRGS